MADEHNIAVLNERLESLRQLVNERERLHQQAIELSAAKLDANNRALKDEAILSREFRANLTGRMTGIALACSVVVTVIGLYLSYLLLHVPLPR